MTVPDFPANEAKGSHTVPFTRTIYIEQSDFREVRKKQNKMNQYFYLFFPVLQVMEKGYKRFTPEQSVGLRHAGYIISLQKIVKVGMCMSLESEDQGFESCRCTAVVSLPLYECDEGVNGGQRTDDTYRKLRTSGSYFFAML